TRVKKGPNKAILFAEIICAIGHAIRSKLKQPKNTSIAAKTGAFFLWSYENLGLLRAVISNGANGHGQYVIEVLNDDGIIEIFESVKVETQDRLPSLQPHAPWTKSIHSS